MIRVGSGGSTLYRFHATSRWSGSLDVMWAVRWRGAVLIPRAAGCGLLLLRSALKEEGKEEGRPDDFRSCATSYDSDRYVPKRRQVDDPKIARAAGTITHEGRAVSGASIEATVYPTPYHGWTTDRATSAADGTFSLAITAGNLEGKQPVELAVQAAGMRGRALVMLAPGERIANVGIEVGAGVTVRGRVIDETGSAVEQYDMTQPHVCLGRDCGATKDDGSFELTSFQVGRQRFEVVAGGVTHVVKELPLGKVAPSIVVDHLSGFIGPILLQVDRKATEQMFNAPSWSDSTDGGTARVRVVPGRDGTLPATIMCMSAHGGEDIPVGDGRAPIVVPVLRYAGRSRIECDPDNFDRVRIQDPAPGRVHDVPLVHTSVDDIDLGVELRAYPTGARVVGVADEAKDAGLRPDDIVTAIDGISVANTNAPVVRALGFRLPPGKSAELAIMRGEQPLTIVLRSPP